MKTSIRFPCFISQCPGTLALIPSDLVPKIEEKIRSMALAMCRKYGICAEDLYQAGAVRLVYEFRDASKPWSAVRIARYGMLRHMDTEFKFRKSIRLACQVHRALKKESCTFEGLLEALDALQIPPSDRLVFEAWLAGNSPRRIALDFGKQDSAAVKQILARVAATVAAKYGRDVNLNALWPGVYRDLPKHVTQMRNKYVARVRRNGKRVYLGTFSTVEEAEYAVHSFLSYKEPKDDES